MYELYKLKEDLYQIHSAYRNEKAMEGTLLAILTYSVHTLGFRPEELEIALIAMLEGSYDAAHFGVNRTFIFPFNRKDKKKAS